MVYIKRGNNVESLVLGQILSISLTMGNFFNRILSTRYQLDLAALQLTIVYVMMAIIFWLALVHFSVEYFSNRKFWDKVPQTMLISLVDASAGLLAIKAAMHVDLPTQALLATISTPTTMILSKLFLKAKYRPMNVFGVALAILGVALASFLELRTLGFNIVKSDLMQGHLMCIVSAILYGISNVFTEHVTKSKDTSVCEYLVLCSTFSAIWSFIYLVFLNIQQIPIALSVGFSWAGFHIASYCCCLVLFYSLLPIVMYRSSATLFNMSLLTANFYSVFIGFVLLEESISWSFIIPLVLVMSGLILFNLQSHPIDDQDQVETI